MRAVGAAAWRTCLAGVVAAFLLPAFAGCGDDAPADGQQAAQGTSTQEPESADATEADGAPGAPGAPESPNGSSPPDGDSGTSSGQASERAQVRALMTRFADAVTARDVEEGCALSAQALQQQFAQLGGPEGDCAAGLRLLAGDKLVEDLDPRIISITVDGDEAEIVGWVSHLKERQTARFVQEAGEWKLLRWFEGEH